MADLETRVLDCFSNVFPDVAREALRTATQDTIPNWDSVAHITLFASLAEEFAFELDYESAEAVHSFAEAMEYVRAHATNP
ncbi:MAG TPA: hypothetical protein VHM70_23755 [Polyangiaceae bacterium]|jgi:acyl carrier protein|nr:hypothetical protein [Polyangiaceae bacterium]